MIECNSCSRVIHSDVIHCARCYRPYHPSCSHKQGITSRGFVNICCSGYDNCDYRQISFNQKNNFGPPKKVSRHHENVIQNIKFEETHHIDEDDEPQILDVDEPEVIVLDDDDDEVIHESLEEVNVIQMEKAVNDRKNEILAEMRTSSETNDRLDRKRSITNDSNKEITLETVWNGISGLQNSITNISGSLKTVFTNSQSMESRITELEKSMNIVQTKLANLDHVQEYLENLKEHYNHLQDAVEKLKSQKTFNLSEISGELRAREIKSKNVIIYRVPEDNLHLSNNYSTVEDINRLNALISERDKLRVREIFENIPQLNLNNIKTRRIGSIDSSDCRPLRVILSSKEDMMTVIRNRHLINRPYFVKTDLTRCQRKKLKELREELLKINQTSTKMTIRFINDEPTLVPIDNFKNEA
ncbi:uncharacterized protein LOC106658027 [Trichogramma pretiosum]|uniref:uncharacterized protein LOC106658027 n=1 Tax=Trichogramma pretiosum TaxID=7493 RepID=UPI0006C9501D|nr:uncharacterized protein LOC106658027 [Trichogramma pretiosum]